MPSHQRSPPCPPLQGSGTLSSSVSSGDIERQYTLNPQGTLRFTVGSTLYSLDFSSRWYLNSSSIMVFQTDNNLILLCSHDPNKPQHRLAQECTQTSKIYLQRWKVKLIFLLPAVEQVCVMGCSIERTVRKVKPLFEVVTFQ